MLGKEEHTACRKNCRYLRNGENQTSTGFHNLSVASMKKKKKGFLKMCDLDTLTGWERAVFDRDSFYFKTPAKLIRPFEVLKDSFSCLSKPYSIS